VRPMPRHRVGRAPSRPVPSSVGASTIGRAFWGKGYATEAAKRCLDFAFEDMHRDRVISLIDPENTSSIRVAERIGETLEGGC